MFVSFKFKKKCEIEISQDESILKEVDGKKVLEKKKLRTQRSRVNNSI